MIGRQGLGWQTTLADMSLILFMVASAAASAPRKANEAQTVSAPALEAPVAVYRSTPGQSLARWLEEQGTDPRLQLTIRASHRVGERDTAIQDAQALAAEMASSAHAPRIVIEPGERTETIAILAYDRDGSQVAHLLHSESQIAVQGSPRDVR